MTETETPPEETPLEIAQRYVAETEALCTRLTERLEKMEARTSPQATDATERLLATLDRTLAIMREHLQHEKKLARSDADA